MVRLISMAMTGYYRTMQRPRAHQPLSMLKYDPIGTTPSFPPFSIVEQRACLVSDIMPGQSRSDIGEEGAIYEAGYIQQHG
jgi:hypothetical protein